MPNIGNINLNLHTVDRDETIYARPGDSVSSKDQVALRRTLPKGNKGALRTNIRFERAFVVDPESLAKEPVVVSIACTVPPGVPVSAVTSYVEEALTQAASTAGSLAISGDIHIGS